MSDQTRPTIEQLAARGCPYCDGEAIPCKDGARCGCVECGRTWTAAAWKDHDAIEPGYSR